MNRLVLTGLMLFLLGIGACSQNGAAALYETATFEELQNNKEHAIKLYEEILSKYPKSEVADKARERLSALRETSGR